MIGWSDWCTTNVSLTHSLFSFSSVKLIFFAFSSVKLTFDTSCFTLFYLHMIFVNYSHQSHSQIAPPLEKFHMKQYNFYTFSILCGAIQLLHLLLWNDFKYINACDSVKLSHHFVQIIYKLCINLFLSREINMDIWILFAIISTGEAIFYITHG